MQSSGFSGALNLLRCAICKEIADEPVRAKKCFDLFCKKCFEQAASVSRCFNCPACAVEINVSNCYNAFSFDEGIATISDKIYGFSETKDIEEWNEFKYSQKLICIALRTYGNTPRKYVYNRTLSKFRLQSSVHAPISAFKTILKQKLKLSDCVSIAVRSKGPKQKISDAYFDSDTLDKVIGFSRWRARKPLELLIEISGESPKKRKSGFKRESCMVLWSNENFHDSSYNNTDFFHIENTNKKLKLELASQLDFFESFSNIGEIDKEN